MEHAIAGAAAGAAEVGRYGRRIVKMVWDPEPTNDRSINSPVWCLGSSYTLESHSNRSSTVDPAEARSHHYHEPPPPIYKPANPTPKDILPKSVLTDSAAIIEIETTHSKAFIAPPQSNSSSISSSLAYNDLDGTGGWPPSFLEDIESRIWMTYRSGFPLIARSMDPKANMALSLRMRLKTLTDQSGFSSDSGWGCMIRSGQSLLANTLLIHELGRDWRRGTEDAKERRILSNFADDPTAPYSIHNFVKHGAVACGKYPGEWFGPSATARSIRALANAHEEGLRIYTTGDLPDVYEDSFMALAKEDGETFHPTLILVGTKLGLDSIHPVYWEALTATLQMPQSVGIAGGRPMSSHYFVGTQRCVDEHEQGSYLFYLDPHYTRAALPFHEAVADYTQADIESCHTSRLRWLHIGDLDPSMLIGFLIKDEEDWDNWQSAIQHVQGKAIINVSKHDPARGSPIERAEAIDEVELIDSDDDGDTLLEA